MKSYRSGSLVRFITFAPVFFIPAIVLAVMYYVYVTNQYVYKQQIQMLKEQRVEARKSSIKTKVEGVVDLIEYQNSILRKELRAKIKDRVDTAYKISKSIYEKFKNTKSSKEIKSIITTTLRPLTWNNGESFIWILNYDGVFQLAPKYLRHLEGKSIIDFKDATGRSIIKEEIKICKDKGSGFLIDTFTKPNGDPNKQYKQIAYVKAFGIYDWYLGSSEYIDTASKISNKKILNLISKVDSIGSDYIYVSKTDGTTLLNKSLPQKYIGVNILEVGNQKEKSSARKLVDAVENLGSGFVEYDWLNPETNIVEKKYSFIKKVKNSDWFVGSGFYESELSDKVGKEIEMIKSAQQIRLDRIFLFTVILTISALILSLFIAKLLKRKFYKYENKVRSNEKQLEEINENLEKTVQLRTQELQILATTDALTGIANRYSIMEKLQMQIDRVKRTSEPLSLIMYDFDHFKDINDKYGHNVGDEVLKGVTKLIKNSIRDMDIIGRYGGEEFLIILPNTDIEKTKELADRLREKVASQNFSNIEITISMGVVEYGVNESLNSFIKRVDDLMYKSKNSGRNTVSY